LNTLVLHKTTLLVVLKNQSHSYNDHSQVLKPVLYHQEIATSQAVRYNAID